MPSPRLSVIFVTDFTLDWSSQGKSDQRSPVLRSPRSSDFSQPPACVFVAYILCRARALLVASNVSPALPEPSAKIKIIPCMTNMNLSIFRPYSYWMIKETSSAYPKERKNLLPY